MSKIIDNDFLSMMGDDLEDLVHRWIDDGVPVFLVVGVLEAVKCGIVVQQVADIPQSHIH